MSKLPEYQQKMHVLQDKQQESNAKKERLEAEHYEKGQSYRDAHERYMIMDGEVKSKQSTYDR